MNTKQIITTFATLMITVMCATAFVSVPTITDGIGFQYENIIIGDDRIQIGSTNITKEATFMIAASDSLHKEGADFICGGVDDQVVIQAAIDALPDTGGKVVLMEGTYNAHSIKLQGTAGNKNNVEFVGSGWGTIIRLPNMTRHNIIDIDGMSGCLVSNMQLDGNYANQDMTNWAMKYGPSGEGGPNSCVADVCEINLNNIFATNSDRVSVVDVHSHSSVHNAILYQDNVEKSMVRGCYVKDCQWHGIEYWRGGHYSSIVDCYCENCYRSPIIVELGNPTAMHVIVANCITKDDGTNYEQGIRLQTASHITVSNCITVNQTIGLAAVDYCTVIGNAIQSNGRRIGIQLEFDSDYNKIIGNTLSDNGADDGIQITAGSYNLIEGNTVVTGTYPGIRLMSPSSHNQFTNNIVKGIVGWAFYETAGCDHNKFSDNVISDCSNPISITGANSTVRNNVGYVTENSGTATLASGTTVKTITHGLAVTPVAGDIMITPTESLGSASFFWIDGYTATTFNVTVNADPTQDVDIAWSGIVL